MKGRALIRNGAYRIGSCSERVTERVVSQCEGLGHCWPLLRTLKTLSHKPSPWLLSDKIRRKKNRQNCQYYSVQGMQAGLIGNSQETLDGWRGIGHCSRDCQEKVKGGLRLSKNKNKQDEETRKHRGLAGQLGFSCNMLEQWSD